MAAPRGNQNAVKKPWAEAIGQALDRRAKKNKQKGRMEALIEIAEKLLDKAEQGDAQAFKEIGDRMDGKPHQTIAAEVDTNVTVEVVRFGEKKK